VAFRPHRTTDTIEKFYKLHSRAVFLRYRDDPRSLAEAERNPEIYRGPPDYPYTLGGVCCEWG